MEAEPGDLELLDKAACRVSDPEGNGGICARHAVYGVKVLMTLVGCQILIYGPRSAAGRAYPKAWHAPGPTTSAIAHLTFYVGGFCHEI